MKSADNMQQELHLQKGWFIIKENGFYIMEQPIPI